MGTQDYIFGYGSLASEENLGRFLARHAIPGGPAVYARLNGFRRAWNVAMDNMRDVPGYKFYVDAETRQRHTGAVTFLNVYRARDHAINGLVFPVPPEALCHFDRREQNYERIEVTADVEAPAALSGRIWLYIATVDGLTHFQRACRTRCAVVDRSYISEVEAAFIARGEEAHRDYLLSTDHADLPAADLIGIDIPHG